MGRDDPDKPRCDLERLGDMMRGRGSSDEGIPNLSRCRDMSRQLGKNAGIYAA
jgi:hypothetical protein